MAPPGRQIVIVQKLTDINYEAIDDWASHKAEIEDSIIHNLDHLIPGFSKRIIIKSSASALTSWRFTLNQPGAMLGWEMSPDQLGEHRPSVNGLLRNLYFTGHWTQPGGGITPVIISAMKVARMVTESTSELD